MRLFYSMCDVHPILPSMEWTQRNFSSSILFLVLVIFFVLCSSQDLHVSPPNVTKLAKLTTPPLLAPPAGAPSIPLPWLHQSGRRISQISPLSLPPQTKWCCSMLEMNCEWIKAPEFSIEFHNIDPMQNITIWSNFSIMTTELGCNYYCCDIHDQGFATRVALTRAACLI